VGVQEVRGSRPLASPGHPHPEVCLASTHRFSSHPPADSSRAYRGGQSTEEADGAGGRDPGRPRVPRLAADRRQNHCVCAYPLSQPHRVHGGCREGEGVLPPRGDSLHHHPAGVRGDGAPQLPRLHGGLRPRLP